MTDPTEAQLTMELEQIQVEGARRDGQMPVSRYAAFLIEWRTEQQRIRHQLQALVTEEIIEEKRRAYERQQQAVEPVHAGGD